MFILFTLMIIHTIKAEAGFSQIDGFQISNILIHSSLVGAILIVSLFFGYLAIKLVRKLEKTTEIINTIARGDFHIEIDESLKNSPDEFGDLANALNKILVTLKLTVKRSK